jgi:hypothetical protein
MVVVTGDGIDTFTAAGAVQANEQFAAPAAYPLGLAYGDALADGARFWSLPNLGGGTAVNLTKHSTWTWTAASSTYWVAYTWYDGVGTAHETLVSPRASIVLKRRQQLVITTPPIPGGGGADEPSSIRFYMLPNATDPGSGGAMKQQASQVGTTLTATTYNAAGAADPGTNNYPAGTPATIKSQTTGGGWSLKGDGTSSFMQLIAEGTGSSLASLSLTLPRTYRSLMLEIEARTDNAAGQAIVFQLNGDTAANYFYAMYQVNGTSVPGANSGGSSSLPRCGMLGNSGAAAGVEPYSQVWFANADSASLRKMYWYRGISWTSDAIAGAGSEYGHGMWVNVAAAIASLKLMSSTTNFAYIRARLYGVP